MYVTTNRLKVDITIYLLTSFHYIAPNPYAESLCPLAAHRLFLTNFSSSHIFSYTQRQAALSLVGPFLSAQAATYGQCVFVPITKYQHFVSIMSHVLSDHPAR